VTSGAGLNQLDATEILRRAARGEITAEAVTRACLARCAEREPAIHAWTCLDPDRAIEEARRRDRAAKRGPLYGLAVAVKDTFDTADMPTAYGSPIYAGFRPAADAACVATLRAAGAVVLGKTVTTEFAAPTPGPTRNPHRLAHTPGGSSSGSAAAVADRMATVSLGSQTKGSLVRPAAYCGLVGFKPSYGTITRVGLKSQAESIDAIGIMARSIDDAALFAAVLADRPAAPWSESLARPPRIGVYRGPDWSKAEAPAIAVLDDTIGRLRRGGAEVFEVEPPALLRQAYDAQLTIVFFEMSRGMTYEWFNHRAKLSPALAALVEQGFGYSAADYDAAEKTVLAARQSMVRAFAEADAWLTLSAPGEAPEGLEITGDTVFNRLWSVLHLPAITVPVARGPNGLPLGVQLVGPFRGDGRLLSVARWLHKTVAPQPLIPPA
jgi:amidase